MNVMYNVQPEGYPFAFPALAAFFQFVPADENLTVPMDVVFDLDGQEVGKVEDLEVSFEEGRSHTVVIRINNLVLPTPGTLRARAVLQDQDLGYAEMIVEPAALSAEAVQGTANSGEAA